METKRLILRRWNENDAEALYKYAQNPNIGPIAGWPPHTSVEDSKNVIRNILSAPETYAVVLKETQEPIGSVGIMFGDSVHSADMQEGDAEIGYWIVVPYWGKGLIPEAVHRLLEHCFEDLGIKRVWCGYYDGNFKSPSSIFCNTTCFTRPFSSAMYSIGLCSVRNSTPSSLACFTSSRRAGISASERR